MAAEVLKVLTPDIMVSGLRVRFLAMETTKSKWNSIFIGARFGRYLIFETPKINSLPVIMDEGSHWSINFINNGQIYTFNSLVIGSSYRPVPLVFFTFPDNITISNLRTDKRYPVNIPMTLTRTYETDKEPLNKGLILDLSWGGCLVASTTEIPEETILNMTFYLENSNTIEGLMVERKSSRNNQGTFYSGLSFLPSNPIEVTDRVAELINEIENTPLRL
jgi:c-di-GMP-binding flagellar brake protein YcgR